MPTYGLPEDILQQGSKGLAKAVTILNAFSRKWHPTAARVEYETNFSVSRWEALSNDTCRSSW